MSEEEFEEIRAALNVLVSKMPFLIGLTPDERMSLVKLGDNIEFVTDCQTVVKSFGQILPPSFDNEEFMKDSGLFKFLHQIKTESRHTVSTSERLRLTSEQTRFGSRVKRVPS